MKLQVIRTPPMSVTPCRIASGVRSIPRRIALSRMLAGDFTREVTCSIGL